jgi:hypothetical protein
MRRAVAVVGVAWLVACPDASAPTLSPPGPPPGRVEARALAQIRGAVERGDLSLALRLLSEERTRVPGDRAEARRLVLEAEISRRQGHPDRSADLLRRAARLAPDLVAEDPASVAALLEALERGECQARLDAACALALARVEAARAALEGAAAGRARGLVQGCPLPGLARQALRVLSGRGKLPPRWAAPRAPIAAPASPDASLRRRDPRGPVEAPR